MTTIVPLRSSGLPDLDRNIINKNFKNLNTDVTTLETTKVPYTGATSTVNLGSQKIITGEVESVGDLTIDCGTEKTLVLQEVVYEDLRFPAAAINPIGIVGAATVDTSGVFVGTLLFAPGSTQICCGMAQFPHSRKLSSDIHAHIHWSPTTTGAGSVYWLLEYVVADIDGTFPGTYSSKQYTDAADGVLNKHQLAPFPVISSIGSAVSTMMCWRLSRVGGELADDYAGDARLLEFDLHYQIDTVGSRTEMYK